MLVIPENPRFNYIIDNLAVGSIGARNDPQFKAIISLMPGKSLKYCDYEGRLYPAHTTNVLIIPIHDGEPGLKPFIEGGIKFIDDNIEEYPVLVHCHAGISRSPSMVIAYLMSKGLSFPEAITKVYMKRPCIDPWHGFVDEIKEYFKS